MFGVNSAVSISGNFKDYRFILVISLFKEWIFAMGTKLADPSKLQHLDEEFNIVLPFHDFNEYRRTELYARTMLDEIQTFYFGEDSTVDVETFPELVQVLSDAAFGYGVSKSADKHATLSKGKTYYYR